MISVDNDENKELDEAFEETTRDLVDDLAETMSPEEFAKLYRGDLEISDAFITVKVKDATYYWDKDTREFDGWSKEIWKEPN